MNNLCFTFYADAVCIAHNKSVIGSGRQAGNTLLSSAIVLMLSWCKSNTLLHSFSSYAVEKKSLSKIHQDNMSTIALINEVFPACLPLPMTDLSCTIRMILTYHIKCILHV